MQKTRSIIYALLAAAFYAINIPFSKLLLNHVGTTMAALLYLGAGIGIGLMSLCNKREQSAKLDRKDMPFVIGQLPIFLWFLVCSAERHFFGTWLPYHCFHKA